MGGLRVQRGMRTAHEDVIDMWQGIIDADHEGEQREDNRSKENCRVLRGTFLLVLSRMSRPTYFWLIHVFGETLEKWDESVTLCSSKLMRGGIDANNALIAATGWSRHHRNQ